MKLFKIFLPLFIFVLAFNLYAQENKYLVENEDAGAESLLNGVRGKDAGKSYNNKEYITRMYAAAEQVANEITQNGISFKEAWKILTRARINVSNSSDPEYFAFKRSSFPSGANGDRTLTGYAKKIYLPKILKNFKLEIKDLPTESQLYLFGYVYGELPGETLPIPLVRTAIGRNRLFRGPRVIWFYTDPENIDKIIEYVSSLFKDVTDQSKTFTKQELIDRVAKIHWWLANAIINRQGSSGVTDALTKAIFLSRGYKLPRWKEDISPDMEAFITPLENYKKNYIGFFEESENNTTLANIVTDVKVIQQIETRSGQTTKVSFMVNGEKLIGLMKPVRNISVEDIGNGSPRLKETQKIDDLDYRNAEQAVYALDDFMGNGFVPDTYTYVDKNEDMYTIQKWLSEDNSEIWFVPNDIEAFDFIVGNIDRVRQRNSFESEGKFYAIDNEVAFPYPVPTLEEYFHNAYKRMGRKPVDQLVLSPEMKERINNLTADDLQEVLTPYLKNTQHIDAAITRLEYLKKTINSDDNIYDKNDVKMDDARSVLTQYNHLIRRFPDNVLVSETIENIYRDMTIYDSADRATHFATTLSVFSREDVKYFLSTFLNANANKTTYEGDLAKLLEIIVNMVEAEKLKTEPFCTKSPEIEKFVEAYSKGKSGQVIMPFFDDKLSAPNQISVSDKVPTDKKTVEDVLRSNKLGQQEFNTLFKTDLIANLLKSYKETKSPLDALRLLVVEKIRRQYISYSNTPPGTSPTATDLALRDDIVKMDLGGLDKEYSSVEELKNIIKEIEIDKLDLETDEAKELEKEYETKIDLRKIEVE